MNDAPDMELTSFAFAGKDIVIDVVANFRRESRERRLLRILAVFFVFDIPRQVDDYLDELC
jgi:hypothetical protein